MIDVDPKSLRLFVAVCELRNIKSAALQAHIEPSAISKRIALLEQQLGTPLLVRGHRGVHPTPAGVALLEHARGVLFALERLQAEVAAFGGGVKGHVRLVASASAIAEVLLDDLSAFMQDPAHREIRVDVEERISRDVVRSVREGSASIGVCWDAIDFEQLELRPYRSDELRLALPAGHALAGRPNVRLAQTLALDHVGLAPTTAVHRMLARAAAQAGGSINYRVVVSTFDAVLRAVGAGLGVAVIPRVLIERAPGAGIVGVPLDEPWAPRRFALCFRRGDALTPAAARLVEHLVAAAGHAAPPGAPSRAAPPQAAPPQVDPDERG